MPIYLKFGKVLGKSKGRYKDWIELTSCQLGNARHVTSGEGAARLPEVWVNEIMVTKEQDTTSTELFRSSLWGEGVAAEIEFTKKDAPTAYMHLDLENVLISSYSISGHGGASNGKPMESLSLNFTKIAYKYSEAK